MIRRHEQHIPFLLARFVDLPDRGIGRFAAFYGGGVYACVADHVGGSEVVHEEFVVVRGDAGAELGGYAGGAHFGVEVVGGYFGGGDHVAVFAGELFFDAPVEEEGYVGVFFGFGDVALFDVFLSEVFGEDVAHVLGTESYGEGVVGFVLGHCRYIDVFRVGEVWSWGAVNVTEKLGYFADTVRAIVEEEEGVVLLDSGLFAAYYDGFEEFVVLAFLVLLFDCGDRVG